MAAGSRTVLPQLTFILSVGAGALVFAQSGAASTSCQNLLPTCDLLTTPANTCYQETSLFVSTQCCLACEMKKRPGLPMDCAWGNRVTFCDMITVEKCSSDISLKRDCCESCYNLLGTSTVPATSSSPVCQDSFNSATCRNLLISLGGNCTIIQKRCCGTCALATTTMTTTTTPTAQCLDTLGRPLCESILLQEGSGTPSLALCNSVMLVKERCCAYCRELQTTTTTAATTSATTVTRPTSALTIAPCFGDLLDCSILAQEDPSLCTLGSALRQPCCAYCAKIATTTGTTFYPSISCINKLSDFQCESITFTNGPAACQITAVRDSCCLHCRALAEKPCNISIDQLSGCQAIQAVYPNICHPSNSFYDGCCAYCLGKLPSTTAIPSATTAVSMVAPTSTATANNTVQTQSATLTTTQTGSTSRMTSISDQTMSANQTYSAATTTWATQSTTSNSSMDLYPRSCKEYFLKSRSNESAVYQMVDPDGMSQIISPTLVLCTRSGNAICTKLRPISGRSVSGSTDNCTVTRNFTKELTDVALPLQPGVRLCSSAFTNVTYNASSSLLNYLISTNPGGCKQVVTWSCAGHVSVPDDASSNNLFSAIKHHGHPMARVYNLFDPEYIQFPYIYPFLGPNQRSTNGACDCELQGCSLCNCAQQPPANGTDTITIQLTSDRQEYVEGLLLGQAGPNSGVEVPASHKIEAGDIECCDRV